MSFPSGHAVAGAAVWTSVAFLVGRGRSRTVRGVLFGVAVGLRPVHTVLLGAEIPIIEHLVNLEQLPPSGFTFTAAPPKIKGAGTFTVRAFASV